MSDKDDCSMTPEAAKFQSLPQAVQRQILTEFPCLLAKAAHGYSLGADCEVVLRGLLEGAAPMLRVRNKQGDAPIASALIRGQRERAKWLADLALEKQPQALDDRARYGETLLMLSTGSLPDGLLEKLLERDPTELHRLYDLDGRNLLHHCSLEDSAQALTTVLRCVGRLLQEGRLEAAKVAQAVNMNDQNGDTPLHLMAARDRADLLRLLVDFCANSSVSLSLKCRRHVDKRWTPLMTAAAADAVEVARLLLDEGAELDDEDTDGRTAADLAGCQSKVAALFASLQPEAPALATAVTSVPSAVDSGVQSVPSLEQPRLRSNGSSDQLRLLDKLEARLSASGKSDAFLDAMSRLSDGRFQWHGLPVEKPIATAFSMWWHSGQVPAELLRRALDQVAESAIWNELAVELSAALN